MSVFLKIASKLLILLAVFINLKYFPTKHKKMAPYDFGAISYDYIIAVTKVAKPKNTPGALARATGKSRFSLNKP